MAKDAEKRKEAGKAATPSSAAQPVAQEMMEAYRAFLSSLSQTEKSLMDLYMDAQKKACAAHAEYARKVQTDWGKPDVVNEAFKTYSATINDIQSAFQAKWTELAEQAAKGKADSYRAFVRKVHTSWNRLPVHQLTPAEAVSVGQLLHGVATLSQMFGGAK
jgi:hypothetical protein